MPQVKDLKFFNSSPKFVKIDELDIKKLIINQYQFKEHLVIPIK